MKYLVVITVLVGVAAAQKFSATRSGNEIVITRSESENNGDGTFKWASELSDGTKLEQSGYVKAGPDPEKPIQVIEGSYSYITPEGETINLKYIADENGFQPEGVHLPTPPPIPEEIQKALNLIQAASSNQVPQFRKPLSQPRRF
ncbi:Larval cuticle protein LCP-17 [Orchesella cincta]|uniref:Larval cuticle protein LCP-17 n=1 Tax=Orchesella cincta TaxID=48709 RepID=A0A1D2MBS1_ORCCI|nr:Larval cuticle protein LCP-17 [Orchesella cincta]